MCGRYGCRPGSFRAVLRTETGLVHRKPRSHSCGFRLVRRRLSWVSTTSLSWGVAAVEPLLALHRGDVSGRPNSLSFGLRPTSLQADARSRLHSRPGPGLPGQGLRVSRGRGWPTLGPESGSPSPGTPRSWGQSSDRSRDGCAIVGLRHRIQDPGSRNLLFTAHRRGRVMPVVSIRARIRSTRSDLAGHSLPANILRGSLALDRHAAILRRVFGSGQRPIEPWLHAENEMKLGHGYDLRVVWQP